MIGGGGSSSITSSARVVPRGIHSGSEPRTLFWHDKDAKDESSLPYAMQFYERRRELGGGGGYRFCSLNVGSWVTPCLSTPTTVCDESILRRLPDGVLSLVSRAAPDVVLFQEYGAYPDSLAAIGSPGDRGSVPVGFGMVDRILGGNDLALVHNVKAGGQVRVRRRHSFFSGSAVYSRCVLQSPHLVSGVGVGVGDSLVLRARVDDCVTVYNVHHLLPPSDSAVFVAALCADIMRCRRKLIGDHHPYIVVMGDFVSATASLGSESPLDALRACGMILVTSGPNVCFWASLDFYQDFEVTPARRSSSDKSDEGEWGEPPSWLCCFDAVRRSRDQRLLRGWDVRGGGMRMVCESCIAHVPDVEYIGGPHVVDRFGHPGVSAPFVMYTNFVKNERIREMTHAFATVCMPARARKGACVVPVFLESVNGWWVLDVGGRKVVWGYMAPASSYFVDSSTAKVRIGAPHIHFARAFLPDDHFEYSRWLGQDRALRLPKHFHLWDMDAPLNVNPTVGMKVPLMVVRHFRERVDDALCRLIGCAASFDVYESNLMFVRLMEGLFMNSVAKLDCIKKSHAIWVRFASLNASLAAGRADFADSRERVMRDFKELWLPLFEYYNGFLSDPVSLASDITENFVMFRSQNPASGFLSDKVLESLKVGDTVQTSSFTFATYSPLVQTIVLSKSFDMEVVFIVRPHLVRELFLLSNKSHNAVKGKNLPCIFLRDEIIIPPFAVHEIMGIETGFVASPLGTKSNLTHSGTANKVFKKIAMYFSDKVTTTASLFMRRFFVVEFKGFSRKSMLRFDAAYGTHFSELYTGRTLLP